MKTSFWFAVFSPLASAVIAFAAVAAVIRGSRINSHYHTGASIWDVC